MYQGQPMFLPVTDFHLEILRFLYDHPSSLDKKQFDAIIDLAADGLKADMELLSDQRVGARKALEQVEELRKRADLCPFCGTPVHEANKNPDMPDEIDPQNIPATKEAAYSRMPSMHDLPCAPEPEEVDLYDIPLAEYEEEKPRAETVVITVDDILQDVSDEII